MVLSAMVPYMTAQVSEIGVKGTKPLFGELAKTLTVPDSIQPEGEAAERKQFTSIQIPCPGSQPPPATGDRLPAYLTC